MAGEYLARNGIQIPRKEDQTHVEPEAGVRFLPHS
jgi:hypothetical protein